jgi:hypothetical protein
MRSRLAFTLGLALAVLAGCPTRDVSQLDPNPDKEQLKEIPVSANRDVDILFVIDNSKSMKEEQDSLRANFPRFIDVLNTIEGGLPNVHLGVVSSDMGLGGYTYSNCSGSGDDGALQYAPSGDCPVPTDPWIEDVDDGAGGRRQNYTGGTLDQVFGCIANLGTGGCGFEQHFESMKRGLERSQEASDLNTGFLRPDAFLAVIFLADEDDCSPRDGSVLDPSPSQNTISSTLGPFTSFRCAEFGITCDEGNLQRSPTDYTNCVPRGDSYFNHSDYYYDFLTGLKDDPNLIYVAAIAGNEAPVGVFMDTPPTGGEVPTIKPSCQTTGTGKADPGVRIRALVDRFGSRGTFTSICQEDLTDALDEIAKALKRIIGTPCLEGNLRTTDINPTMPGLQLECQVSYVRFPGSENEQTTVIPRCPMTNETTPDTSSMPCWWTQVNETSCNPAEYPTSLELLIEKTEDPPSQTYLQARCMTN